MLYYQIAGDFHECKFGKLTRDTVQKIFSLYKHKMTTRMYQGEYGTLCTCKAFCPDYLTITHYSDHQPLEDKVLTQQMPILVYYCDSDYIIL